MSTRILGGSLKGRLLKSPTGPLARPTTSIMRKSVFDICQSYINDSHFLDLFACSGAMGIEALSRGAAHSTFIEKDRKTFQLLMENLKNLELQEKSTALSGDSFSLIKKLSSKYNIIYIDPPYPLIESPNSPILGLLKLIDQSSFLSEFCTVFLEERAPGTFNSDSLVFQNLRHKNTRQFGSSLLHQLNNFK
jgi:16S rRNA (guanine966-N2)-methyltransferase